MLEFNSNVFDFFQQFSHVPGVGVLADLPIFFLPIFLTGMWLYYTFYSSKKSSRIDLLHIFYACVLGIFFSYIIKQFVDISRPEMYLEQTGNLIMSSIPAKSFPSDHATVSLAFTTSLLFTGYKRLGYIFLPIALIMNISRIIVGVHWPLDIIAGSLNGIFAGILFFTCVVKSKLVNTSDMFIIRIMKILRLY